MGIRAYKAYTPGTRNRSVSEFDQISKCKPYKLLTSGQHRKQGRNNRGVITSRYRGGGHKRLYRTIDFKRDKTGIAGHIVSIEYDPNRNAHICLTSYEDGQMQYTLHPRDLKIGDKISSGSDVPIMPGNTLPLSAV